ncbi:MAG TPA: galactose-1-phosphate uridylyltransferase, partial [Firmicutes bacterium]|nr:galactose-1-phosphate uridylyltransferase [Bacillota bacterium]
MAIIDKLIHYAKIHLDLLSQDEIFIRNRLLELLRLDDYTPEFVADDTLANLSVPDVLLDELR